MKRLILLLFAIVVLTACQNEPCPPNKVRHLGIYANDIYYQDGNYTVFCVENASGEPVKTDLKESIFQIDGKIYLVGDGKISVLSEGSFVEKGTAPDSTLVELIGIVEDWCYYTDWEKIVSWNCSSSEEKILYSFDEWAAYPFGVTTEGVFYGTYEGLFLIRFTSGTPEKIIDGNITSVQAADNTIYFAVSTQREAPARNEGDDSQVYDEVDYYYDGAAYYKYDEGNLIRITAVEHVRADSTRFAVSNGILYGVAANFDETKSILWWASDNGELNQVTLSENIDASGGIEVEEDMIVIADMQANIWLFDRTNNTLKMLTKAK